MVSRLKATAAAVIIGGAGLTGTASAHAPALSTPEARELTLINRFRASHRLPKLRPDRVLMDVARWKSKDMGQTQQLQHVDSLGRDAPERIVQAGYPANTSRGEVLAGAISSPRKAYRMW